MIIVHPARDKISDKELAVAERETRVWPLESLEACQLFCFSRKSIKYATHTLWQRRERLREPLYFSVQRRATMEDPSKQQPPPYPTQQGAGGFAPPPYPTQAPGVPPYPAQAPPPAGYKPPENYGYSTQPGQV